MNVYIALLIIVISFIIGYLLTTGVKSQLIRIIDICFFGPFLIWMAFREKNTIIQIILLIMGATTISYNLKNYYHQK